MLPRSQHTRRTATIPPPNDIPELQEYVADIKSDNTAEFLQIDPEQSKDETENDSSALQDKATERDKGSGFTEFMPYTDFREILSQFFVSGHKKLFLLQSKIRNDLEIPDDGSPPLIITNINVHKIEALRQHYYTLQIDSFFSSKGKKCDILL